MDQRKEQRLNRVGLNYRCGRCGQPKKGHTCSSKSTAKVTKNGMHVEARTAAVTTNPLPMAVAPISIEAGECMQPKSLAAVPVALGLDALAEQAGTAEPAGSGPKGVPVVHKETSHTAVAPMQVDQFKTNHVVVAKYVDPRPLLAEKSSVPSSTTMGALIQGPTPALAPPAPALACKSALVEPVSAPGMQASVTGVTADATARAEAEADARRALAVAEIFCAAPSLLQFAHTRNVCERALSPVRESSPKVNRFPASSKLGAKSKPRSSVSEKPAKSAERGAKRSNLRCNESPPRVRFRLRGLK